MSKLRIRSATEQDLTDLIALLRMESNRVGFFPPSAFKDHIGRLGTAVASYGGHAVGMISGYTSLRYARWCRPIAALIVHPSYRRRGIASALIEHEVNMALTRDQSALQAWSREDLPANLLWRSLGWEPIALQAASGARNKRKMLWRHSTTAVVHAQFRDVPPVAGYRAARSTATAVAMTRDGRIWSYGGLTPQEVGR